MEDECLNKLVKKIIEAKAQEIETVSTCPPCHYKSLDFDGGCEVYRADMILVALVINMDFIPELCPIRQKILDAKAELRRQGEEFEEKHKR
jgi:hypothetical protein